jgi:serine/threonine-protein kinase
MFTQLHSQPPIPLSTARKGLIISPAVEAVVMKGLSRDPAGRYPDVLTFGKELRAAVEAPPPKARAEGLVARMKSMLRKGAD